MIVISPESLSVTFSESRGDGARSRGRQQIIVICGQQEATEKEGINGVKVGLVSSTVHNILFKRFGG